ncbi:MAG: hypothetical protein KBC06_02480 [Candidatus Pacebacteria bacterium]|nr:hypothetical protein [Candidatus Paceibacterota bacterium]
MRKKLVSSSHYLTEAKKKKREAQKRKIFIFIALFVFVFVALGALSRWSKLNIKQVEVSGNVVTDSKVIQEFVEKEISGNYLWVFPKSNFLIYPKGGIEKDLQNDFKIMKDLSIRLTGVNKLTVNFKEREGAYTWCGNDPALGTSEDKCYFMDKDGYIFGEAPYFSGDVFFKFFGQVSKDVDVPLGMSYFPDLFNKLISLREATNGMGIKTSAYFIKPDGDIELYFSSNIPFPSKPKIIFPPNTNVEKMAENLQTALSTEPLQTDFKKKFAKLVHIDLRYGNKVYYKFTQ